MIKLFLNSATIIIYEKKLYILIEKYDRISSHLHDEKYKLKKLLKIILSILLSTLNLSTLT